jgi:putative N6-adenine-specific DNA methylase
MHLIATCAFGLEKLVYDEIKKLGLWVVKTEDGRVIFEGDELALIRANLWLRCADRVQIQTGEFQATTFEDLFNAVNNLPWEQFIAANDAFPVHATSIKSVLHSQPAIQSIVKKSIVKRLQQAHKVEFLPENSSATHQIIIKINKDQCVISIDSSGDSLHKRGYRTRANAAPIKETLAAAMVKLSDWTAEKALAGQTLIDPFCGSGTIAIEAALIAQNMAPGLHRKFAFQQWEWIHKKYIQEAFTEARAAIKPLEKLPIYCFDIDPDALTMAQENAKCAGIPNLNFKRSDFQDLDFTKFENCTFITNPPYGDRMEDEEKVATMYRTLGKKFAETKNSSLFLITSSEFFPQLFGRKADKNRKLFNGGIRCYLFSYIASL